MQWCDWKIPLHWGGLSDPFQPAEIRYRNSYECLKIFAKTHYPFVVSTKGKAIIREEYLKLLAQCNCVVQISMVCSKYDILEQGAPTFEERLNMVQVLSSVVKRVNIRIQPYMTEVFEDVLSNISRFKSAGAYGIIIEGMKFAKKKTGLVKVGADYVYDQALLERHFTKLREEAHRCGMAFYVGENRLRSMGDNLTCCGIDGLDGFQPNEFNLCHMLNGAQVSPTKAMDVAGSGICFQALGQSGASYQRIKGMSFKDCMLSYYADKKGYVLDLFGKSRQR